MGLFSFFKKSPEQLSASEDPYKDSSTNLIYNLLFCDNIDLYKKIQNRLIPIRSTFCFQRKVLFRTCRKLSTTALLTQD
jgi:FPC/CPF motif-containing protein YcgG